MADVQGQITSVFSGLISGGAMMVFWIFLVVICLSIIGGIVWYFGIYRRNFDIMVKIISKRSGENREIFDKAGIFHDKKNNTRYLRLLKTRIELELPKFDIMRHTNWGDYVEVLRVSERGFRFLTPPIIDKDYFINVDGRKTPMAEMKHRQIEMDITFILEREKRNKKIIDPEGLFIKILDHLPSIMSGIMSLFIIYFMFKYAPQWLDSMKQFVDSINAANAPQIVG